MAPDDRYTPSSPPSWFLGGERPWNLARELFVHAGRLNRHAAQHQMVGVGLLLAGLLAGRLGVPVAAGWAMGTAGCLALVHGWRQQRFTRERMSMAIGGAMLQCDNPAINPWTDAAEKHRWLDQVQRERLASPPGSFDELMNAVAEASLTGRMVRAPVHWWYGQRFLGFVPGPGRVAGSSNPPDDPAAPSS